jgi:hypothetical protein
MIDFVRHALIRSSACRPLIQRLHHTPDCLDAFFGLLTGEVQRRQQSDDLRARGHGQDACVM